MGSLFTSCCGGSSDSYEDVDRDKMREAAEKRMKQNESRGIKDVESVKRQQAAKEQMEKMERNQTNSEGGLRWQVG